MISALERIYLQFLKDGDTAKLIDDVARRYTLSTLHRIAESGRVLSRRAAVLSVGWLGQFESNCVLGRALSDRDRGVRLTADASIREIWLRVGDHYLEGKLRTLARWNSCGRFLQVLGASDELFVTYGAVAELWHQRAVAQFGLAEFEGCLSDCLETLERNPFHFSAASTLGRCNLALDRIDDALSAFRQALAINPTLEHLRGMVRRLERTR